MREILFRGKRVDNGEWVEGFFVSMDGENLIYAQSDLQFDGSFVEIFGLADDAQETKLIGTEVFQVIPETVGQYTGLKDKNGKRIFEGDVIDCWSEGVHAQGEVQQNRGGLWIIYPAWQKYIMWGLCPNDDGSTDVEVIGNIHDNPELLKEV